VHLSKAHDRDHEADFPEIKILGFQSGAGLRFDENVKHSYFIYPDENVSAAPTKVAEQRNFHHCRLIIAEAAGLHRLHTHLCSSPQNTSQA
jgi:hypothetical protein